MFHLVRGSVYLLIVFGAPFSFLYTDLVTIFTYIVFIFTHIHTHTHTYIYIWWCMLFLTYLFMCCFFSIFIHMFLYVCNLYFCFILRCLDKFYLKCFKKTSYENLSCHELSFCKVFQEFVLGLDLFVIHKCYEFSDLRLLSWFICLLWFCHGL